MNNNNIAILVNDGIDYPDGYELCLADKLDTLENNSCDNIYLADTLDYLSIDKTIEFLEQVISKLKRLGALHIKAPDLLQLCWYATRMNIDLAKLRYIIFDTKRKNCYSIDECILLLNDIKNLTVESIVYCNGYEYSITAKKQALEVLEDNEKEKTSN